MGHDILTATLTANGADLGEYSGIKDFTWEAIIVNAENEDVTEDYEVIFDLYVLVKEKPIDYEFEGLEVDYTGEPQRPTLNIRSVGVATITYLLEDGSETDTMPSFVSAGTHPIYFKIEIDSYETEQGRVDFVINKIDPEIEVLADDSEYLGIDWIYFNGELTAPSTRNNSVDYKKISHYKEVPDNITIIPPFVSLDGEGGYVVSFMDLATGKLLETAPADCGKYRVIVTSIETTNYNSKEFYADYEIKKVDTRFDNLPVYMNGEMVETEDPYITGLTGQYGQTSDYLEFRIIGSGDLTISYVNLDTEEVYYTKPTDAGNYKIVFNVTDSDNYNSAILEYEFKINQRVLVITGTYEHEFNNNPWTLDFSSEEFTIGYYSSYVDEENHLISGIGTTKFAGASFIGSIQTVGSSYGVYVSEEDFILSDDLRIFIDGEEVDASNYRICINLSVTIVKAKTTIDVIEESLDVVYDGTIKLPQFDFSHMESEKYTVYYGLVAPTSNSDYSNFATTLNIVNAGEYRVYYRIDFEDYQSILGDVILTINKATPTITLARESILYTGYRFDLFVNGLVSCDSTGAITYSYTDSNNSPVDYPIFADTYTITFHIAEDDNYLEATIEKEFVIEKQVIDIIWSNTVISFTGDVVLPDATVFTAAVLGLTIAPADGYDGRSIGAQMAIASISNTNYVISEDTVMCPYEITRTIVEFTPTITMTYTGDVPTLENGNGYEYSGLENLSANVGEYEITMSIVDLINCQWNDGSEEASRTVRIIITAKDISTADVAKTPIGDQTYTGSAIKPIFTMYYKTKELVKGVDYEVVYENNVNVFSHAKMTVTGIGNFTGKYVYEFYIESNVLRLENSDYKFMTAKSATSIVDEDHVKYSSKVRTVIANVEAGTTVEEFLNNFTEVQRAYIRVNNGTKQIAASAYSSTYIGTGMRIVYVNAFGTTIDAAYVSVRGDLDGDGLITVSDLSKLMNHVSSANGTLKNEFYLAADINRDGNVDISDYTPLSDYVSGKGSF